MGKSEGIAAEDLIADSRHKCEADLHTTDIVDELVEDNACHGKNNGPTNDDMGHKQGDGYEWLFETHKPSPLGDLTEAYVLRMRFNSEQEAHDFYNSYAKVRGFSIRKDRRKVNKDGFVRSRKWVCSRQGQRAKIHLERSDRKKAPRALTRVGCLATFRIRYDQKVKKYVVTQFVKEHNHSLATSQHVHFLRSHRSVKDADKAQTKAMRDVGVKPAQIMDFIAYESGGYEKVGFTYKDLYNHIDVQRREEVKDGDAETALVYLRAKFDLDPFFFYKYDLDPHNRLKRLFWADSMSQQDYAAFGDVLVFDTTYRTNAYKKPFVLLAGVSNHFTTCIFGCALLSDETTETYTWVLETLIEAMNNKRPMSVVTDGDMAMREAIRRVLPECKHRLCTWHLETNAKTNVKTPNFCADFTRCMQMDCGPDDFENAWSKMVERHGLANNPWILETHSKRHLWAEAYLRGCFFAGMKSTQRCEGMNAFFNKFLKVRLRLYEFLRQYDRALGRIRYREAEAEARTKNADPVLTTSMKSLEKHAADIYTQNIFKMFCAEIKQEGEYTVKQILDRSDHRTYYLEKYNAKGSRWKVLYYPKAGKIKCCCKKFESFGIPCCHMISIMKSKQLRKIPQSCVVPRWTRRARLESNQLSNPEVWKSLTQTARYGFLCSAASNMCYYASHTSKGTEEAREIFVGMTPRMKELCASNNVFDAEDKNLHPKFGVGDPHVVKTKGKPRGPSSRGKQPKPRRCGHCRGIGHTRRTCLKWKSRDQRKESNLVVGAAGSAYFTFHDEDGNEETEPLSHMPVQAQHWGM